VCFSGIRDRTSLVVVAATALGYLEAGRLDLCKRVLAPEEERSGLLETLSELSQRLEESLERLE
jgi:hypothetical protein